METLNKIIEMNGNFELFDNSLLKIRGSLEGNLSSKGDLLLKGRVENHGSFPIPDAEVTVTKTSVKVITTYLGSNLTLNLNKNGNIFLESDPIVFEFQLPISYTTELVLDNEAYIIPFNVNVKCEIAIKLCEAPPEFFYTLSGNVLNTNYIFNFSFDTNIVFKDIQELHTSIIKRIIDKIHTKEILEVFIIKELCNLKLLLENELEEVTEYINMIMILLDDCDDCYIQTSGNTTNFLPYDCGCPPPLIKLYLEQMEMLTDKKEKIINKIDAITKFLNTNSHRICNDREKI